MKYLIVPDIHGQFNQLIFILSKYITLDNNIIVDTNGFKIIFLGDYIDKNENLEKQSEVIKFIYNNLKYLILIKGNHELKSFEYINNIRNDIPKDYNYHKFIKNNKEERKRFEYIYQYLQTTYIDNNIQCSHSPCLQTHLNNNSKEAIEASLPKKKFDENDKPSEELYKYFFDIINENRNKLTVFGHFGLQEVFIHNNIIFLDTSNTKELNFLILDFDKKVFNIDNGLEIKNIKFQKKQNLNKSMNLIFSSIKKKKEK